MALKIEGNVTIQNYVESGATVNNVHIDHVDNLYTQQEHPKKELAATDAVVEEISYTAGGLADYVRIPARLEEILTALHTFIDGKKGRAVAVVVNCAMEEGLINRPTFPVLQKEFGDIGSPQAYSKAMNEGFSEAEKRRFIKAFALCKC